MAETTLAAKTCTACQGGTPAMTAAEATVFQKDVPDWAVMDDATRIERRFKFGSFKEAFDFVTKVARIAESEGHHPDISFGWGYAQISTQTKKIKGLHENDFILAAKIDAVAD